MDASRLRSKLPARDTIDNQTGDNQTGDNQTGRSYLRVHRVRNKRDFQRIQGGGRRLHGRNLLVLVCDSTVENSRLGLVVSRRVDKRAVVRNRIKRRLREIFRLNHSRLLKPVDIVIVARREAALAEFSEIEREILKALGSRGLLR